MGPCFNTLGLGSNRPELGLSSLYKSELIELYWESAESHYSGLLPKILWGLGPRWSDSSESHVTQPAQLNLVRTDSSPESEFLNLGWDTIYLGGIWRFELGICSGWLKVLNGEGSERVVST
ncbi:hypothetical protein AAC387_Pa09g0308 [Persea americana]